MTPSARYAAAIYVLDKFLDGHPVEKILSNWARKNRYAGSKDRAAVRDIVFDCLRKLSSFQAISGIHNGRGLAIGHCLEIGLELKDVFNGEGYAPEPLDEYELASLDVEPTPNAAQKGNLPDWVFRIVSMDHVNEVNVLTANLSRRAPVDLRVNTSKTNLNAVQLALEEEGIVSQPLDDVATALRIVKNPRRVVGSRAFADGWLELQDAASQAVVEMLDIQPNNQVLDFCAGGGGKTLAMAAAQPGAKFDAWDISAARLKSLKVRAKRAGATVFVLETEPSAPTYDLVFVDAPCSGSGSWRRNPEGKWRLTSDRLNELQRIQAKLLQQAAVCTKPGGILAYVTCSIFDCENRAQVDKFLNDYPAFALLKKRDFSVSDPGDGFFCAILQNNSNLPI
ncbi:MAG: RsmB/NOP family class I SAM-dependent RNA methyltransferase [Amylibacter sp.]|nr:RsmB/NOP family class I SAM-dependent RNA methyltransferase [Amylibacter sp.]